MNKKFIKFICGALILSSFTSTKALAVSNKNMNKTSIVVDSHNDTMMLVVDENTWLPKTNIKNNTNFHIDIPKLKKGGLNVGFFASYTSGYYGNTPKSLSRTLALINALYWTESNNKDNFKIANSVENIYRLANVQKIVAIPTIEGGYGFDNENTMELIKQYNDLNVKAVGFTWNSSNDLGEGANKTYGDSKKTPSTGGLTVLGEDLVKEMNKLGMIVDVSHMAESTFWDVIETSKSPIMATHSGVYNLKNHQRNLNDKQLKALAKNGGVIGIVFYPPFLTQSGEAYIKDMVDHIDYVVKLVGVDHVAIGSDFDGGRLPLDLKDASEFYKIGDELKKRGYSNEDLEKIMGLNTIRLLKTNENLAKKTYKKPIKSLFVKPEMEMGKSISSSKTRLSAKIISYNRDYLHNENSKIIVDGISYEASYDLKTKEVYIDLPNTLKEKFHIITFDIIDYMGNSHRETRIFYIK